MAMESITISVPDRSSPFATPVKRFLYFKRFSGLMIHFLKHKPATKDDSLWTAQL